MSLSTVHELEVFALDREDFPSRFTFDVGGYGGTWYQVDLDANEQTIEYTWHGAVNRRKGRERVAPSGDQWRSFRDDLDELGIWNWVERYSATDVVDSTNWSVLIHWGTRRIESSGSSDFPRKFEAALTAVSRLIGGRAFR